MVNTIDIDPHGDLILVVSSGYWQKRYRVSQHVLRLASPRWQTLLSQSVASIATGELHLPEDDSRAMSHLLHMMHLKHDQLPVDGMHWSNLGEFAELCHKYGLVHVAEDRLRRWLYAFVPEIRLGDISWLTPSDEIDVIGPCGASYLWIGWVLKDYPLFEHSMKYLLDNVSPSDLLTELTYPPQCKEFLLQQIKLRFHPILSLAYSAIEGIDEDLESYCDAHATQQSRNKCALLQAGLASLFQMRCYLPRGESRAAEATTVSVSLRDMNRFAKKMWEGLEIQFDGVDHAQCFAKQLELRNELETLLCGPIPAIAENFGEYFGKVRTSS